MSSPAGVYRCGRLNTGIPTHRNKIQFGWRSLKDPQRAIVWIHRAQDSFLSGGKETDNRKFQGQPQEHVLEKGRWFWALSIWAGNWGRLRGGETSWQRFFVLYRATCALYGSNQSWRQGILSIFLRKKLPNFISILLPSLEHWPSLFR